MHVPKKMGRAFAPLLQPNYLKLQVGGTISRTGTLIGLFALTWFESKSVIMLGVLSTAFYLPLLLIPRVITKERALIAIEVLGVERAPDHPFRKRLALIFCQYVMMMMAGTLTMAAYFHLLGSWLGSVLVVICAFVTGSADGADKIIRQNLVAKMVVPELETIAIGLNNAIRNSCYFLGPPLAGYLYQRLGLTSCLGIDEITYAIALGSLLLLRLGKAFLLFEPPIQLTLWEKIFVLPGTVGDEWLGIVRVILFKRLPKNDRRGRAEHLTRRTFTRQTALILAMVAVLAVTVNQYQFYLPSLDQADGGGPVLMGWLWGALGVSAFVGSLFGGSVKSTAPAVLRLVAACAIVWTLAGLGLAFGAAPLAPVAMAVIGFCAATITASTQALANHDPQLLASLNARSTGMLVLPTIGVGVLASAVGIDIAYAALSAAALVYAGWYAWVVFFRERAGKDGE